MLKSTHIISELDSFFAKKDSNKAINSIMVVMRSLRMSERQLGVSKHPNSQYSVLQIFHLLVLFPFFTVKNAFNFPYSSLGTLFSCQKDVFYRFMENGGIDWRKILYSLNLQLIQKIACRSDSQKSKNPVCVILDDSDFPKTGMRTEFIGRIYSHVLHKSILGFKGLFLCRTDGKTQTLLDFSLHGEQGKKQDKPQGLTAKQRNRRFSKQRMETEKVNERIAEYKEKKTDRAIGMVKYAISKGIRFDYLLLDSWFTNTAFVKFMVSRHIKCHLLGMIKMGTTKYKTTLGELSAKAIVALLQKRKEVKYSRALKCHYCEIQADFAGTRVKLFFCKRGKKGSWNGLLTTDTGLDFFKAYRIYSMRWAIEVCFYEGKGLLGLGKSQARNFTSQIASISLTMIQYNILSLIKRFEAYQTIGGLFREVAGETMELSVTDKIWELILEVVSELAELFSANENDILEAIINNNDKCRRILNNYNYRKVG